MMVLLRYLSVRKTGPTGVAFNGCCLIAIKPARPRQTTSGLPDVRSTLHTPDFLGFQLKQDSLGSTRSQAGRYR